MRLFWFCAFLAVCFQIYDCLQVNPTKEDPTGYSNPSPRDYSKKPPPISENIDLMMVKHMRMARIVSAVHLHNRVAQNSLLVEEVIAQLWNMHDGRIVIEHWARFNEKELKVEMPQLEKELDDWPDEEFKDFDIDAINKLQESVFEIDSEMLKTINESVRIEIVPEEFQAFLKKNRDLFLLQENLAQKMLESIKKYNNKDATVEDLKRNLVNLKKYSSGFKNQLTKHLEYLEQNRDKLSGLFRGLAYAKKVNERKSNIGVLFKKITENPDMVGYLKKIYKNHNSLKVMIGKLDYISDIYRRGTKASTQGSMIAGFVSNHTLTQVFDDLKHPWTEDIFFNIPHLHTLSDGLEKFRPWMEEYENGIEKSMQSIMGYDNADVKMMILSDFLHDIADSYPLLENIQNLTSCLQFKQSSFDDKELDELAKLDESINAIEDWMDQMVDAYDELYDKSLDEKLAEYSSDEAIKQDIDNFETILKNSTKFFDKMRVKQSDTVFESIDKLVKSQESLRKNIVNIQNWLKIDNSTCVSWKPLDTKQFHVVNEITNPIKTIKEEKYLPTFLALFEEIYQMEDKIHKLRGRRPKPLEVVRDRRTRKVAISREVFIEVPNVIHNMHKSILLVKNRDAFKTISYEDDYVKTTFQHIKNPRKRKIVEDAWKDWDELKKTILDVQYKNEITVHMIRICKEPLFGWVKLCGGPLDLPIEFLNKDNMAEIGWMYHAASRADAIMVKIELREIIDSFRCMNQSDPKIQEIYKALKTLEYPISMDWYNYQWKNQRMPFWMDDVRNGFQEFFRRELPPPPFVYVKKEEVKKKETYLYFFDSKWEFQRFLILAIPALIFIVYNGWDDWFD